LAPGAKIRRTSLPGFAKWLGAEGTFADPDLERIATRLVQASGCFESSAGVNTIDPASIRSIKCRDYTHRNGVIYIFTASFKVPSRASMAGLNRGTIKRGGFMRPPLAFIR
jgi:hypothetical protein